MNRDYHHGFHHYRRFRHPSRLLWFIIGGVAATWYIKRKEKHSDEYRFGCCRRPPIQAPQSTQQSNDDGVAQSRFPAPRDHVWGAWEQQKADQWEEEKARLLNIGRQAGDTVIIFYPLVSFF
jgi:hypothetical protein